MRRWAVPASWITAAALALALALAMVQPAARADTPDACSRTAISVYFAEGAHQPTLEAAAVLARTGADLADCDADRVSIVARFSPNGGKGALDLALERLARVADALARAGVDVGRLRIAAMPTLIEDEPRGPGRVDVWAGQAARPAEVQKAPPETSRT